MKPYFDSAGLQYPPRELAFVAFKDSKRLELYAKDGEPPWRFIKTYPVLAASGKPGPKLAEGDRQVPEGVYRAESLNPNSRFHLSVRLDYPNELDRRMAEADGRTNLGGDIMIHGSSVSVGCLAMGDDAAEDLFVLAGLAGRERVRIVVSPTDFRAPSARNPVDEPRWIGEHYETLRAELQAFRPPHPGNDDEKP